MTPDEAGALTLARRSSGYSVYAGDTHVVFVIAPSFGFGVAALIVGGLAFILGVNGLVAALNDAALLGVVFVALAVGFGVITAVLHRFWKRHANAGLDWPNRYVFDRREGTLVDGKGDVIATRGELGARRSFAFGSRSVFVELVTARRRLPVYQVYTGGFGRGPEADAVLAQLATWGIPTVR